MITRLRKRFIKISTLAVTCVLLLLTLSVNTANFISTSSALNRTLKMIADNRGTIPHEPPQRKPGDIPGVGFNKETPFSTRYFVLKYTADGILTEADLDKIAAVTKADTDSYLKIAIKHSEGFGLYRRYKYYVKKEADGSFMAIFLDAGRELSSAAAIALLSVAATAACVILVYIIVVLCSKKAIAPVIRASEKQKQFITDAGHELKTPITVISTGLRVLEMEAGESRWIKKLQAQTERLKELVNSLVALSRMDEDSPPWHMATFDISAAISETAQSFKEFAEASGHILNTDVPPNIEYHGDEYAVRQLTSILLDNAIKYSPVDSAISIWLIKTKKGVTVKTLNKCAEIKPEQLERLFDRFYRADFSRSKTARGFGIGLSIARSICEGHSGSIKAESPNGEALVITAELK